MKPWFSVNSEFPKDGFVFFPPLGWLKMSLRILSAARMSALKHCLNTVQKHRLKERVPGYGKVPTSVGS